MQGRKNQHPKTQIYASRKKDKKDEEYEMA
jgi:hypothetical protein